MGPLVGGTLLEHFWWGSVFLLNVPVMALMLVLAPRALPESRDHEMGPLEAGVWTVPVMSGGLDTSYPLRSGRLP